MKVTIDIDIDKFRYSLVGDGYVLEEVADMTSDKLVHIFTQRVTQHINKEYDRSKRLGLLTDTPRDTWSTDWKEGSYRDISENLNARWDFFKGV
jgi:hypothetical protein